MKATNKTLQTILFASICIWIACSQPGTNQQISDANNDSSCTIMDPNNTKPMALAMRTMASNADAAKQLILQGSRIDSTNWPIIRFSVVQPTDPSVLEPLFYENAAKYYEAHTLLYNASDQQKAYNTVIDACVNCHESYCSGPLKKIRKLYAAGVM
jgi:hypothetical protein